MTSAVMKKQDFTFNISFLKVETFNKHIKLSLIELLSFSQLCRWAVSLQKKKKVSKIDTIINKMMSILMKQLLYSMDEALE